METQHPFHCAQTAPGTLEQETGRQSRDKADSLPTEENRNTGLDGELKFRLLQIVQDHLLFMSQDPFENLPAKVLSSGSFL